MRWEVTEKRQREKLYMRRRFLEWRLKVYEEKSKRNIWRRKNQRSSWGELGLFLGEKMGKKVWILLNGPRMWDIVKDFGSNFEEKKQNKKKVRKLKRKSYSAFDGRYFLEKKKKSDSLIKRIFGSKGCGTLSTRSFWSPSFFCDCSGVQAI